MNKINRATISRLLSQNLPKLSLTSYKGNNGKIGVLGGSVEYTGAPYYAGLAALRAGADIAHIFTPAQEALLPLKCYSPELIVHWAEKPGDLLMWLPAIHSLVVGPGLGRNTDLEGYLIEVCEKLEDKILIGDADFLWHCTQNEKLREIINSKKVILTPNEIEF